MTTNAVTALEVVDEAFLVTTLDRALSKNGDDPRIDDERA